MCMELTTDTLLTILITLLSILMIAALVLLISTIIFARRLMRKVNTVVDVSSTSVKLIQQRLMKNLGIYTVLRTIIKKK